MATWLTWLADALRDSGLEVVEYQGWKTRSRVSGGFIDNRPFGVMVHHTASPKYYDGIRDANHCAVGSDVAPICNLYIDRKGIVWVLAAGATNTNGKGRPIVFSKGTVPLDTMNTHAVGIECGNDGIGERWPQAQVDALIATANVVNARCGNLPSDVCTHHDYAPTRKIDPATTNVAGPWVPRAINKYGTWNLDDLKAECVKRGSYVVPPEPPPLKPLPPLPFPPPGSKEDEMRLYVYVDENGTIWIGNGVQRRALESMDQFSQYVMQSNFGGGPQLHSANGVQVRQLQDVAHVGSATIDALGEPT